MPGRPGKRSLPEALPALASPTGTLTTDNLTDAGSFKPLFVFDSDPHSFWSSYNIEVDDTTLESLERIGMSLGEEIVNFQRREGYKVGYEEASRVMIGNQADVVINLMSELGLSREDAMRLVNVSNEDRDEDNRIVDEKLSSN